VPAERRFVAAVVYDLDSWNASKAPHTVSTLSELLRHHPESIELNRNHGGLHAARIIFVLICFAECGMT